MLEEKGVQLMKSKSEVKEKSSYQSDYGKKGRHSLNTDEVFGYSKMIKKDQLNNQKVIKDRFLTFWREKPIRFPPTYKMSTDSAEYNTERIPGWTDRIFHRKGRIQQN